jgi:DNA-directed RNA polymerase specialized sigma subunit
MENVLTFEQELERDEQEAASQAVSGKKAPRTAKAPKEPKEPKEKFEAPIARATKKEEGAADRLGADASAKLAYYLRKTPQYQVLRSQVDALKVEYENYKKNGSVENQEKTEQLLMELSVKLTRIKNIFKSGSEQSNPKKKEELFEKFKNSEKLQGLLREQKELVEAIRRSTPNVIVTKIVDYRKNIDLHSNVSGIASIEDLDTVIDSNKQVTPYSNLEQDYFDYCGMVADMVDLAPSEIMEMQPNKILVELKRALPDNAPLKEKLTEMKMKIASERDNIADGANLTDIVFEIFDFKDDDDDGAVPREILASANIPLVKSIAYNICSKLNQQSKINDAISSGLLGLTVAINKWYSIQKMSDSALSFKGFANSYIAGSIQRGLLELTSSGTISGSSLATMATMDKRKIEQFVKYNPQFEGFDKEVLSNMLSMYDEKEIRPMNVVTESEYSANVTGDEGESADIWANAAKDSSDTGDFVEAKLEYERLLVSIKDLLDLFDVKTDSATGIKMVTEKRLFSKYDRKLFMMYFGLEYKREKSNENSSAMTNQYTQQEMADELAAMYAADGIHKTFSQASLSGGRIPAMMNKIKFAMQENPKLKAGFEYIFNYWNANTENMNKFSNNREEIGMKVDRDELREIYSNNSAELGRQLSDGTKLSDVFEISDTNPLDSDIAELFND